MNSFPLISIIIPCYNDTLYIEQSVQSALDQTYPNKEVILIDDGSNLETKAVLRKMEPLVTKLITQENKGQSAARNAGIKAAKGDLILVLDSDDYFEPSFCEEAVAVLDLDISIKIVTCQATLLFPDNKNEIYIPNGGGISNFMYANCALGTSMFKKEDWKSVDGYDESMRSGFEDWEFFIRLLKNGGKTEVIHKPLYNYRKRKNSTTSIANVNKYELLKYVYTKHQELYKEDFDGLLQNLLSTAALNKKNELKRINSIDYRLGNSILKPFRFIKQFFKK